MAKRTGGRSRQKHGRWAREIARWRRGGESVRAFCRRRGLKEPSFYYWRRRIEADPVMDNAGSSGGGAPDVHGPAFAELRVTDQPGASAPVVELTLPTGEQLRIGDEVSGEHLQRVISVVREVYGC